MAEETRLNTISLNDVRVQIRTDDGNFETIRMIQSLEVNTSIAKEIIYEAGSKGVPITQKALKKEITGSFERSFIDTELLSILWSDFESDPTVFQLSGVPVDDVNSDKVLTVTGCLIDGIPTPYSLDEHVKQTIGFTATGFRWS